MIDYERDTIQVMRDGQNRHSAIGGTDTRRGVEISHPHLSESQRRAVEQILASRDQVTALEGVAGAGKTTSLTAIRETAERERYKLEGFAPTSGAAQKLREARIESSTLQRHLARTDEQRDGAKRLYVLDESSLASTKQMNEFLYRLKEYDRVLLQDEFFATSKRLRLAQKPEEKFSLLNELQWIVRESKRALAETDSKQ